MLDTGIFNEDRYFDVFVEYAKASPEDIYVRITAVNRGPETAELHILPTLWFRNTWSWWPDLPRPALREASDMGRSRIIQATHDSLDRRWLYSSSPAPILFTENNTNNKRLFNGENATRYVKDGINDFVVHGNHLGASLLQACRHTLKPQPAKQSRITRRFRRHLRVIRRNF